ncbi:lysozyme inhibitor LprI family protein [Pseudochrobactrum sp. HB0163]|uniref:lysozyme inhibitor LprI family protein n=1 Tax=Pseudochrobactrum sp. HB0163 TaxID=3450708 RepID=UPI003F6DD17A
MIIKYIQGNIFAAALAAASLFFISGSDNANAQDCSQLQTQSEITSCFGNDEKNADNQLNIIYKNLMGRLAEADKQNLRNAQRAWIVFRDKECAFRTAPYAGGSVAPSLKAACVTSLTSQRILDLRDQMQCGEGDLACVPHAKTSASQKAASTQVSSPAHKTADMNKGACSQAVGAAKAKEIADRCLEMSSSSHPPCNVENSCNLMIEEIKQGCAQIGAAAPKYCKEYQ